MTNQMLPAGLWPVMLTPYNVNGSIDFNTLDRLIEFYLQHGASGLFANCLSSEMYQLTQIERKKIVQFVINRVNGRVPIIASGTFGENTTAQIEHMKLIENLGVAAVVIITNQLALPSENDDILKIKFEKIMTETQSMRLGLYECPIPYKRLITPELLGYLAATGRFIYHKDTSCNSEEIRIKLKHIKNTPLGLYNANTPTALDSLIEGGRGISAISANFYPELYAVLCRYAASEDHHQDAIKLQCNLSVMDAVTRIKYPLSAKIFLTKRGFKININNRNNIPPLSFEERKMLDALYEHYLFLLDKFRA